MKVSSTNNILCCSGPCADPLLVVLTHSEISSEYIQECKMSITSIKE